MNTKTRKKQENLQNEELRNHLYAQIEIEWNNNRNADLVDELAFQHPELASDLYEFFALLVETEIEDEEDENGGDKEDSENRLARWLQNEGFDIALKAGAEACHSDSTSPNALSLAQPAKVLSNPAICIAADSAPTGELITYDKFLRAAQKRESMKANQIALEINTPLPLIFIAEENFDPQFDPLRDEISNRYARRFNRQRNQVRETFRQVAWAASTGKTTLTRQTVETTFKKLRLPKAEQDYWLTLMRFNK
jgi:hypothetical protein